MKLTDEQIGKIAVEKFNLQECDEEYTYFILGYKEAVNKQFSLSGVVNSTKPKKASKTKKCDYCQKRKKKDTMYFLYKEAKKEYWICDECNWEHDIV
tara:strand:- start:1659 stop:1949 length:291 start_codon:yes stop_codon:yes gene_type:complete